MARFLYKQQGELCFVYHKPITDVNTANFHFAFKTSLAIFKFMKVESKYWRFVNSNGAIFKTDLVSLKCDASSLKMHLKCLAVNCDDHSPLSSMATVQIWTISYVLHTISLFVGDMNSINWPRSPRVASRLLPNKYFRSPEEKKTKS